MQVMVLTIIGEDRPGLVDKLAQAVHQAEGNWLRSSFCQLSGQFAGFIEVMLDANDQQELQTACDKIKDLHITLRPSQASNEAKHELLTFAITANDRKGIIADITRVLNGFELNIVKMESYCENAPNWGNPVFHASVTIDRHNKVQPDKIVDAIQALADDIIVDI